MQNAKATCLMWTAVFLALGGACGWFVYRRAPWPFAPFIGGAVGGLILLIAFSWLLAIPKRIVEWWRIVRARLGSEPQDGKRVAIIGTLRGHGELTAPFSHTRCLLYSYDIITIDVHDGESSQRTMYEGFAMVPLSIEHGTGRTRIIGKPELPSLPSTKLRRRDAESNAKLFVENTTFVPAPGPRIAAPDFSHTEGNIRFDYVREPVETNIGACRLEEEILAADTTVCVLGEYKADRQALVAPVKLRFGTSFAIDAAWRVVNAAIATAIFSAIALGAAAIFCANFPIDAAEQLRPQWTLAWWEVDLERFVDKHVRTPMAAADMISSSGFYLQELCNGCAKGRLEVHGRTIELKHAAYAGGKKVHLSAKPGDRDGVTLDGHDRVVITIDGKSAGVPSSWLQPNDIETALGSYGEYAGRVTVIAPDRWIRCRVYFNTRVDADAWLKKN